MRRVLTFRAADLAAVLATCHRPRRRGWACVPPRHRLAGPKGRRWPDTARLCAADRAQPTPTGWPAIAVHVATGRADATEHGHTPGSTEPPSQDSAEPAGLPPRRHLDPVRAHDVAHRVSDGRVTSKQVVQHSSPRRQPQSTTIVTPGSSGRGGTGTPASADVREGQF